MDFSNDYPLHDPRFEQPLVGANERLDISNFNLSIHSYNQKIDIDTLIKNFEMDVNINDNNTMLLQNDKPVSKHNLSMNKRENKKKEFNRPIGFVQMQYAEERKNIRTIANLDGKKLISKPPLGPIFDGSWCSSCNNIGPKFHKMNCKDPSSLHFTLYGIVQYILGDADIDSVSLETKSLIELLKQRIQRIVSLQGELNAGHRTHYIQAYNDVLVENPSMIQYKETLIQVREGEWPLLNMRIPENLHDIPGVFPNCVVIKYNFKSSGPKGSVGNRVSEPKGSAVSVRVYDNSSILLISCPWEQKNFIDIFLERLNSTKSIIEDSQEIGAFNYEIDTSKTQVKSVFSVFRIKNPGDLDLDTLFGYLWPIDQLGNPTDSDIKVTLTKEFENGMNKQHTYLRNKSELQSYYRYEATYAPNKSKIMLKMLPTVLGPNGDPLYCKPYKISVIIFKGGAIELIFSFCGDKDIEISDSTDYDIPINVQDQFKEIELELNNAKNFLHSLIIGQISQVYAAPSVIPAMPTFVRPRSEIGPVMNNVQATTDATSGENNFERTFTGSYPYKKPLKYKPSTIVDIFDENVMEFKEMGKIIDIAQSDATGNTYRISILDYLGNETKVENIHEVRLRPSTRGIAEKQKISTMQINRPEHRPEPYGFNSQCSSGKNYFIPFGGEQGRDNHFYPKCEKITDTNRKLYLSHILSGFPSNKQEEDTFLISKTDEYDKYSGVFKSGVLKLFAKIRFKMDEPNDYFDRHKDSEGYIMGVIVDFKKTFGYKLDNYIIYSIKMDNGEIVNITSKNIHPSYLENRSWDGIKGNDEIQKQQLIKCTERLGLSQSPFTTQRLNKDMQDNVINNIWAVLGGNYFNEHLHLALTPSLLNRFSKRSYIGLLIPKGAKRVLFFVQQEGSYFIDETLTVMKYTIDPEIKITFGTCILEGFIYRSEHANQIHSLDFYPADCIYLKKKLNGVGKSLHYVSFEESSIPGVSSDDRREASKDRREASKDRREASKDTAEPYLLEFLEDNDLQITRDIRLDINNMSYGRLFYAIAISSIFNLPDMQMDRPFKKVYFKNPIDYCVPSFRRSNPMELVQNNIISDLAVKKPNDLVELLFIPQIGRSSNIRWMKLMNRSIVFQLISTGKQKSSEFFVEIDSKRFESLSVPVSLKATMRDEMAKRNKQDRYMRFYLNFMSNGQLNSEEPLIVDNIKPYALPKDAYSYDKTDLIINALMYPIPVTIFQNTKSWKLVTNTPDFKKILNIQLTPSPELPGTSPLILQ